MNINKQSGFTLAEVLIVLACSAIVGTILVTILVQGSSIFNDQNTRVNQNLSLNSINSKITQQIQFASSVASTFSSGSTTYSSGPDTLVTKIPSVDSTGSVIDSKFDTMIISSDPIDKNILKLWIYPDISSSRKAETLVLTNQLSFIQFSYLNDEAVPTTPQTATRVDFIVKIAEKTNATIKESSISGRANLKNL